MARAIITTNLTQKDLAERYRASLMSVLKESVLPVQVLGCDRRDEAAAKNQLAMGYDGN